MSATNSSKALLTAFQRVFSPWNQRVSHSLVILLTLSFMSQTICNNYFAGAHSSEFIQQWKDKEENHRMKFCHILQPCNAQKVLGRVHFDANLTAFHISLYSNGLSGSCHRLHCHTIATLCHLLMCHLHVHQKEQFKKFLSAKIQSYWPSLIKGQKGPRRGTLTPC